MARNPFQVLLSDLYVCALTTQLQEGLGFADNDSTARFKGGHSNLSESPTLISEEELFFRRPGFIINLGRAFTRGDFLWGITQTSL